MTPLTPEQRARQQIDASLEAAGWVVQDRHEFVRCYNPEDRHSRTATWSKKKPEGRWRPYGYDEMIARDKASLDIFWLRDGSSRTRPACPTHTSSPRRSPRTYGRALSRSRTSWRTCRSE